MIVSVLFVVEDVSVAVDGATKGDGD